MSYGCFGVASEKIKVACGGVMRKWALKSVQGPDCEGP